MAKYLDERGLVYLWVKIRSLFINSNKDLVDSLNGTGARLNDLTNLVNGNSTKIDKVIANTFGVLPEKPENLSKSIKELTDQVKKNTKDIALKGEGNGTSNLQATVVNHVLRLEDKK